MIEKLAGEQRQAFFAVASKRKRGAIPASGRPSYCVSVAVPRVPLVLGGLSAFLLHLARHLSNLEQAVSVEVSRVFAIKVDHW